VERCCEPESFTLCASELKLKKVGAARPLHTENQDEGCQSLSPRPWQSSINKSKKPTLEKRETQRCQTSCSFELLDPDTSCSFATGLSITTLTMVAATAI
jgi:hypothetical protein